MAYNLSSLSSGPGAGAGAGAITMAAAQAVQATAQVREHPVREGVEFRRCLHLQAKLVILDQLKSFKGSLKKATASRNVCSTENTFTA